MKKIYIIMFIILFISSSIYFYILSNKLTPSIIKYSNNKMKRLGIEVLRNVALNEVNELIKSNNLYIINKNNKGEIESIDFNTALLNEALLKIAKKSMLTKIWQIHIQSGQRKTQLTTASGDIGHAIILIWNLQMIL